MHDPKQQVKETLRRKRRREKAGVAEPRTMSPAGPGRPPWAPAGFDLKVVPAEVRQALDEFVQPVYEKAVLAARDPVEKSLGVTFTHLLWLEILDQFDLKRQYVQFDALLGVDNDRHALIAQHLKVLDCKIRLGYFVTRLRELRQQAVDRLPNAPPRAIRLPDGDMFLAPPPVPSAEARS